MYKVFFKESCFSLTDHPKFLREGGYPFVHENPADTRAFVLSLVEKGEPFEAVLYHDDADALLSVFKSCFLCVKAGGGCVRSASDLLLIKRQGMYDLPKGHLEPHETIEQCAVRETEEECGLQGVSITAPLSPTFHIYRRNDRWHLKETFWYLMTCPPGQSPRPQTEEDIEEAFWLPVERLDSVAAQAYPSLRQVFAEVKAIARRPA